MSYPPRVFSSQHTFALNKMLIRCRRPPSLWTTVQLAITIQGARHSNWLSSNTNPVHYASCNILMVESSCSLQIPIMVILDLFIYFFNMDRLYDVAEARVTLCSVHCLSPAYCARSFYHVSQLPIGSLRIFDRNQHSNIRLPNCSKMQSPIDITQSLAITNPIFHDWLKTLTMLKPPLSCTAIYTWYWLTWRPCHWGQPFFTGMPCRNENFRSLRSNFSSALLRSWRR